MRYRSQRVAYPYFVVALLLFGLQMVFGLLSAAKYLGPDPLIDLLPFDVTKVIHTNLLLVWVLTGFMEVVRRLVAAILLKRSKRRFMKSWIASPRRVPRSRSWIEQSIRFKRISCCLANAPWIRRCY